MLKANNELYKRYVRTEKRPDGAVITIVDYYVMKDGELVRLGDWDSPRH